jgi:hypothetical protein
VGSGACSSGVVDVGRHENGKISIPRKVLGLAGGWVVQEMWPFWISNFISILFIFIQFAEGSFHVCSEMDT